MKNIILFMLSILFLCGGHNHAKAQNTVDTVSYRSDSVTYYNKDKSIRFGATLTIPNTSKPCPAVMIISGTGKQDRDGTMAGHKLFAAIGNYLSARGIAVLRVDDRGTGQTTGIYETATTADFAADALTGINYLKSCKEVDARHIGLMGHSEGGAVISIAASQSNDVSFLISLAGVATTGLESLKKQNEDLVASSKLPDYDKQRSNGINNMMFDTVYAYANSPLLEQKITDTYNDWKKKDDAYFKTLNVAFDHFRFPIYSYTKTATGPWYRFSIRYNPASYLSKVKVPILAINGDKDLMVAYRENLAGWKKYAAMGNNKKVTTVVLPGVNHLFQHCITCSPQEYAQLNETIMPQALTIIYKWIEKQIK